MICSSALTLDLLGDFQPLIKSRAKKYSLDLDDARQEAAAAICAAVQSFDPARGNLQAWVAASIDNSLRRLAYGRDLDPLRFSEELDEDMFIEEEEEDELPRWRQENPPVSGTLGRLLKAADGGASTAEIGRRLGITRQRVDQLIAEFCKDKTALGQGDLFGGAA